MDNFLQKRLELQITYSLEGMGFAGRETACLHQRQRSVWRILQVIYILNSAVTIESFSDMHQLGRQ